MRKSVVLLQVFSVAIALVIVVFPLSMFFSGYASVNQQPIPHESGSVILRTLCWSLSVGVLTTVIGWPIGNRISSLRSTTYSGVIITLLMSLAVPAYACYYAWWQTWPAGSWLHEYAVQNGLLSFAMQACLLAALVGWAWPIPALVSAMTSRTNNGLQLLHRIDKVPLRLRFIQRLRADSKLLVGSVLLVAIITSANTTCFDLAQVSTIGNELRAVLASGGSLFDAPLLVFFGVFVAIIASVLVLRVQKQHQQLTLRQYKSLWPILVVWVLLTGMPLVVSAMGSLVSDGFQLWSQYAGDLFVSAIIAFFVATISSLIVVTSMSLQLSLSLKKKMLGDGIDILWIIVACLPAGILASAVANAWQSVNVSFVNQTFLILIFAQVARIGFVGALAGRWVASGIKTKTLVQLDAPKSIGLMLKATRPRLLQAIFVTIALSIAMSFGEVALTTQLSPPSSSQPISVALLHAMHYQRPQIVTSTLFVIISIAAVGGICLFIINRKVFVSFAMFCMLLSCQAEEPNPMQHAKQIGAVGQANGHFMTPRAIDSDGNVIVVIDKTGRIQRFTQEGEFLSSWALELSGTGFPTGVSINEDGTIWIADTHQHRVLVLSTEGNEIMSFGEYGTEEGQFLYPTDIAFGLNGEVYVSEYGGNDRISVFDKSGSFVRSIGEHGESRNGFRRPQSIAIDRQTGFLFVADSGNHRIVVLKPSGEVVRIISGVGRSDANLLYPYGILMDTHNTFIVCEFGNNRLHRFTLDGDSIQTWGSAGSDSGLLRTPWGIAKITDGIVIADTGNNRLQLLPDMMENQ